MTQLRRRMIEDMQLRGLSQGTQQVYLDAIKDLSKHFKRRPDEIGEEELRAYFLHLSQERRLAPSTLRVRLFAVKFLFGVTLQREWPLLKMIRVKRPMKLPVVLSREEVGSLIRRIQRPAVRMSVTLMYACGLRVSEAVHLRPTDIDSKRMVVCVRCGKGEKDRHVPLPIRVLQRLREYWAVKRPGGWLFPADAGAAPLDRNGINRCLKAASKDCSLLKNVSCHTFRHSYATHLLEQGVDLLSIQRLLGHRSLRTTLIYVHLTQHVLRRAVEAANELTSDF